MFSPESIQYFINGLIALASGKLIPLMSVAFVVGAVFRMLIFYTVKREEWFAKEFEKRVHGFIDTTDDSENPNFFFTLKSTLEKTYYEIFEIREIMKRRKPDYVMSFSDRMFLVQHGCALLVRDTLKQARYLKGSGSTPKLLELSKSVIQNNAAFKKLFGVLPVGLVNDVLSILPGIFIVGGIFGTFLGIMKALPELGAMDLTNVEGTKMVMDQFLLKISFSMSTSIMGIVLSVLMTVVNTLFSPEKIFTLTIERYENCLDVIWNRCEDRHFKGESLPTKVGAEIDPIAELASDALEKELLKNKEYRESKLVVASEEDEEDEIPSIKDIDEAA